MKTGYTLRSNFLVIKFYFYCMVRVFIVRSFTNEASSFTSLGCLPSKDRNEKHIDILSMFRKKTQKLNKFGQLSGYAMHPLSLPVYPARIASIPTTVQF